MTVLLKKAFERASKLPDGEQDEFARHIIAELESDERWSDLFNLAESKGLLVLMAEESLKAHRSGKTRLLDPNDL